MTNIPPTLQQALDTKQYEMFLSELCVMALQRAYDRVGQGILSGSSELDGLCSHAANAIAKDFALVESPSNGAQDLTIYIATDLFLGRGGHTPLLLDLIRVDHSANTELILTRTGSPGINPLFASQLRQALPHGVKISELQAESLLQKILILRSYIQSKRPKRIVLVTHQHDVVAYCGITALSADQIIYIHHADTFTLGLYIPWYMVVGTNHFGVKAVANMTGRAMFCWPVASEDHGVRDWIGWESGQGLNTCSHGTERKFEECDDFEYIDIVLMRLEQQPGNHFHIGELSLERRQKIAQKIISAGLHSNRFIYIGIVPVLWKFLKESQIQICISSYPVCSPRGLVETKGCGIPIIIFDDAANPTRSSAHYGYPGCLIWRNKDELKQVLKGVSEASLQAQSKLARASYENSHSLKSLETHANLSYSYITPNWSEVRA